MSLLETEPPGRRVRSRRRVTVIAWSAALLLMAASLAGGALALSTARQPVAHPVLDARFATRSYGAGGAGSAYELWTDPTLARARLQLLPGRESLYYLRDGGVWYVIGRASVHAPWRRTRLGAEQAPSLLTDNGVRRLFAALRAQVAARLVVPTALHNHMAVAFTAAAVSWPYRDAGRTKVWLDAATGLPLQYRNVVEGAKGPLTVLTVVNRLRTVSSAALPMGFFTPPDQRPGMWRSVMRWVYGTILHPSGSS